jgi:hypothetical protein
MRESWRALKLTSDVRFRVEGLIEKYDFKIPRRLQVEGMYQDIQHFQRLDGINRHEQRQAHIGFLVISGRRSTSLDDNAPPRYRGRSDDLSFGHAA